MVTKAVVGLGSWEPGQSTLYDAMRAEEREELSRRGVIGDISGVLVSADGTPVEGRLSDRMIGIDAGQMQAIPEVLAIAYGTAKAPRSMRPCAAAWSMPWSRTRPWRGHCWATDEAAVTGAHVTGAREGRCRLSTTRRWS